MSRFPASTFPILLATAFCANGMSPLGVGAAKHLGETCQALVISNASPTRLTQPTPEFRQMTRKADILPPLPLLCQKQTTLSFILLSIDTDDCSVHHIPFSGFDPSKTMKKSTALPAHTKRPHSPDTTNAAHSAPKKRTRKAGVRNLKQHEWALIHQHHLRRIKEHKNTVFIIDGVQHEWRNVHRKILRANIEHKELSESTWILESSIIFPQS